ncbi:MAG: serine hydrolase domain-containing protein, partial [Bacteroidota bacterium]
MKLLKRIAFVLLTLIIWTAFIAYGFIDGFLLRPITSKKTPEAFIAAAQIKIDDSSTGNLAMVLIEGGQAAKYFFHSIGQSVDQATAFPVASISKWVTAFGVMKMVEQDKVDLDKPIDDYLTRWQLPDSEFDNRKVTVRRLLSHSAGLVDDLGYAGFGPGEKMQTLEESLTKAADAPYSEGAARVGFEPGSRYQYSGAAYTILQLLIEEVSGQAFQEYMDQTVFTPLGMEHSTFEVADQSKLGLADIYKDDGTTRPSKKFTALAAAGLFTSVGDLSQFMIAQVTPNNVLD